MRNAIVCLTRGYSDLRAYDCLIQRNRSIYETINRRRKAQYPLVIWHEGNISAKHQSYILARELNAHVLFVDVSPAFYLPHGLKESDFLEGWSAGYRLMCRFHTYYIWYYTRGFDYIMRLDEDCTLKSSASDPIESLQRAGADFASANFGGESHALTNRTLGPFTRQYAATILRPTDSLNPYNQRFPYTNLYVTRTAFWRQPKVQHFLERIIGERDGIRFRWGDLPVLGVALNLFAAPRKVYLIPRITYRHASHNCIVSTP
jgi:hypothetical protein